MTDKPKYPDHGEIDVEPEVEAGVETQTPICELVFEEAGVCLRCASHEDAVAAVERLKEAPVWVEILPLDDDPLSVERAEEVETEDNGTNN